MGFPAYVKRNFEHKLSARVNKYLFIGYPKESMRYLFYYPTEQKIFVSSKAHFLKKKFLSEEINTSKIKLDEV